MWKNSLPYYEGLYAILDDAEADFADARAVLKGFIPDDIQPIDIYTDFCNKAEASKMYDRDFGYSFTVTERYTAAAELEANYRENVEKNDI